ncbi:MAG: 50S ribosomal protein L18Ae [Candidatus Nanohaloarchaea archaeon]
MTQYSFSGKITLGRSTHGFKKEVEAESEEHAEQKLYSQLGSEHSVPRSKISIESTEKHN